jgi:hypothetical protein
MSGNGKPIIMPRGASKPKRGRYIVLGSSLILLVVIIVAAGGWYFWQGGTVTPPEPIITNPLELIPSNAVSVTEYKFNTPEKRQQISQLWAQQSESQAGTSALMAGDMRAVISDTELQGAWYINIPQETRPYLLIQKTTQTSSLLAQPAAGVSVEKNGWYITHPVSVDSYLTALQAGNLSGTTKIQTFPREYAIRAFLAPEAAAGLSAATADNPFSEIPWGETTLTTDLSTPSAIQWEGVVDREGAQTLFNNTPDNTILSLTPTGIKFMQMGTNFASAASAVSSLSKPIVNQTVLSEPAVKELVGQLNEPYVYYQRSNGPTSGFDIGMIIRIPLNLKGSLILGDKILEHSLFSLAPLITGRSLQTDLTFNDGIYNDLPLKYVNVGGPNQAIDYTVVGDYLFIATSKEGMFALLDKVKTPTAPIELTQLVNELASGTTASADITAGYLGESGLKYLLPGIKATPSFAVGTSSSENTVTTLKAQLLFSTP